LQDLKNPDAGRARVNTCSLFGLEVAVLKRDAAAELLEYRLRQRQAMRLAFLNANLANLACKDPALHLSLRNFLLLNDGIGLNVARKVLYGQAFPDNLNGTDFIPYFLERCQIPLKVFLLGASADVVERAAQIFGERWPQHRLAGHHHGFFAGEEASVVAAIRRAAPDLVLVAMGNGLQERWVERLVPDAALSAWGVGALFDFLAGSMRRAPPWVRRRNLEWGYRLLQEPRRLWQRYLLGNLVFVLRVLRVRLAEICRTG
jgi:exopolysaccharide biosynthesis WecB/TagA/CpsF family protein